MRKITSAVKNRALLTLLAIVMVWGAFTFMLVPEAKACPAYDIEFTYYTDASLTVECGAKYMVCSCGPVYTYGCVTPYMVRETYPCE